MAENTTKILNKISTLNTSIDELEAKLEPLLAQNLPETLVGLETIQQAKLQVAIPYLVYDLIFIYLKTRGIDPKTHPVVAELDRIRQYFDKIKDAEDPAKRRVAVDKGAANRFIKHAIAQVKAQRPPGDNEGSSHIRFDEQGNIPVPVKVTSKMVVRAQYEKELKEMGSEEEDDLEVFEDEEDVQQEQSTPASAASIKGKGKEKAVETPSEANTPGIGKKRRRPLMDPFAGYGDDDEPGTESSKATSATQTPKLKRPAVASDIEASSGRSTPLSTSDPSSARKDKNAAKKARRKAKKTESVS